MKIIIEGVPYPFVHPVEASSKHLIELHREAGLTFEFILDGIGRINALQQLDPATYVTRFLSDIDALLALGGLVFLAKRGAGETVTFAEAVDMKLTDVSFKSEPGDEVSTDPEAPVRPVTAADGNRAARRASTRSPSKRSRLPLDGG